MSMDEFVGSFSLFLKIFAIDFDGLCSLIANMSRISSGHNSLPDMLTLSMIIYIFLFQKNIYKFIITAYI